MEKECRYIEDGKKHVHLDYVRQEMAKKGYTLLPLDEPN